MDNKKQNELSISYYNPIYAKEYYRKHKERLIKRSKERWANMTDEEKQKYYEERKLKRKKKD